jgi:hypothetical protein
MMRKQTGSRSTIEVARVLSRVTGFILAGYGAAFFAGADVAHAAGTGGSGGSGSGGTGAGTGGTGSGGTGTGGTGTGGTGTGGSTGSGSGIGGTGIGSDTGAGSTGSGTGAGAGTAGTSGSGVAGGTFSGTGDGRSESRDQRAAFSWVTRSTGLARPQPRTVPVLGPPMSLIVPPAPDAPVMGTPSLAIPAAVPALPKEGQAFRFDVGTAVFPTTDGMVTTEGVDGVDIVTVDARHHRVIHPAAFFEPRDGAQYDRGAVERFWPIAVGKQVRFVETVENERWLHVMSAVRVETVSVPAGLFRTFVAERTVQSLEQGPRPPATYTYWYAPGRAPSSRPSSGRATERPPSPRKRT